MYHQEYIGGQYHLMSDWQFQYVTSLPELKRTSRFLDLGCGSMRLGRQLVPWLNKNCYTGLDRAGDIVEQGIQSECDLTVFERKQPKIIINSEWDLSECKPVDVAWAQAVFNHLNLDTIAECLHQLKTVLKPAGVLYFTYHQGEYNPLQDDTYSMEKINVYKSQEQITELFNQCGYQVEHLPEQTLRGQTICRATLIKQQENTHETTPTSKKATRKKTQAQR